MSNPVTVAFVPAASAADPVAVATITAIVNDSYTAGEEGMWLPRAARTNTSEIADLILRGQIAGAYLDGILVGSAQVTTVDSHTAGLGMLAADPRLRGKGIGRALLDFVENWARERGMTQTQVEILAPRLWVHPVKDFLRTWYSRLGYAQVSVGLVDDHYPELARQLATPCDFTTYRKSLA